MAAACIRPVENGMEVSTATERVRQVRRTLYEVLLADHAAPCLRQQATGDCELETQAAEAGLHQSRFAPRSHARGGARGLRTRCAGASSRERQEASGKWQKWELRPKPKQQTGQHARGRCHAGHCRRVV